MKRIMELQDEKEIDFTGKQQHKTQKKSCDFIIGNASIILRVLDDGNKALMVSLDLSVTFVWSILSW
jgi:hypothetical protein